MHLRYDLKNKLDLSNFQKQSSFFLEKEDCVFSFYLSDFAVSFNVTKDISSRHQHQIDISISELSATPNSNKDVFYKNINPLIDPRFRELEIIKDLFSSNHQGTTIKSSKQEVIDFIFFMTKMMSKINRLSSIA
jgi:hypothetical protein